MLIHQTPLLVALCDLAGMKAGSPDAQAGDPILGGKIREKRKMLRLSQLSLAIDIGIDRSHVSNIETGRHMPGRKTLLAIAQRLDLSLDFLASPGGEYQEGAANARDPGEAVLLDMYRRLSEEEADGLLRFLLGRAKVTTPPD